MAESGVMERLVSLCKRRGFVYPGSEIYGGLGGTWDYGPLGVELLRNIKNAWWHDMVTVREDVVGVDTAILMHPTVWKASGHVDAFTDPLIDDTETKHRFRADQLYGIYLQTNQDEVELAANAIPSAVIAAGGLDEALKTLEEDSKALMIDRAVHGRMKKIEAWDEAARAAKDAMSVRVHVEKSGKNSQVRAYIRQLTIEFLHEFSAQIPSPSSGKVGVLTAPRKFNLMFKTQVGPVEEDALITYLRPETAQGIFTQFKNVVDSTRIKIPFGIAQIGKSFRNEITPKQFVFRSREFEQMEIEFFCHPSTSREWYEKWRDERFNWYKSLGIKSEKLRLREHGKDELAFYSVGTSDVEYLFPWGWGELEGIAHRGDYDLRKHIEYSKKDLQYFNDETKERYVPHVIEPSAGATRSFLAFLCEAYAEDQAPNEKGEMETRTVLRLHPRLAPVKAAIFPLVKKDGMPEKAMALYKQLQKHFEVFYDEKGAVGRRYRRQDEAGTPFCITIDGQTNEDQTVTIRERDSMKQERIAMDKVLGYLLERLVM